jgi:replicative DNA helicase
MISDIDILFILKNRIDYERFFPFIESNLLTTEGTLIGKYIKTYYTAHSSKDEIQWAFFRTWFFMKHPTMDKSKKDVYLHLFKSLEEYEDTTDDLTIIMRELIRKTYAKEVAEKALRIADGSDDSALSDLNPILETAMRELGNYTEEDKYLVGFSHDELFDHSDDPNLTFSLGGLNVTCDGISKGDFVVIGAHPDTGKTTFLIDQAVHMASQLPEGKKVLYFNNEQKGRALNHRIISRVLGKSVDDVLTDPLESLREFEKTGFKDKYILIDSANTDRIIIERLKKYRDVVGLILFDQLWKVQMTALKTQNEFMALGKQYAWGREIAKEYAPVMTVHQLDGASANMKYIEMQNMFGSKVALQGEADLIINIGRVTDGSEPYNIRHFYVPKNKLTGGDPTQRNNKFDAEIKHDICKFEDVK